MQRVIKPVFWTGLFINAYFFIAIVKVYIKGSKLTGVPVSITGILKGYWSCITFKVPNTTLEVLFGQVGSFFPYMFWITLVALVLMIFFSRRKKLSDSTSM